jgi:pimeloyl-ACP methyl ester carboxylesterase
MKLTQRLALGYIRAKFKLLTAVSKKKAAEKAFELFCTPQTRNKKKIPRIFETGEKVAFVLNDNIVRGWRFNHPAERKVLICHGFESSVINFDRYIKPLIKKGYEVLAFDAPAHGRSAGKKITAPMYKDMILAINKQYGPIRSFMAHSFGGLAVSLALEEISHQADYRLVLIAPAAETTTAIDSFFKFLQLDPVLRPEFEKIILKNGGVSSEWYSIKRAMRNIKAPTRWFQDEDDTVTPMSDVLAVKAENYPALEFVFTTGLGHRRIYRDNKVSRSVVEFL